MKRNYLNFYGNLMKSSDAYLVKILDTLAKTGLLENTLVIATADHGEMGTAHGGMRQKNFNFYEESIRVPLVYSNPRLFPQARDEPTRSSRTSTSCRRSRASSARRPSARAAWEGVDYSDQILSRSPKPPPQNYTVFTYDDYQSGQSQRALPDSRRTTSSASASSAGSSPATTTSTARCPTSGRCTTSRPTRSSA